MDERCKEEFRSSCNKFQAEAANVTVLLNEMIQKQQQLLNRINAYDSKELAQNRNFIIDTTQINYLLFNKMFAINIDLDTFWKKCEDRTKDSNVTLELPMAQTASASTPRPDMLVNSIDYDTESSVYSIESATSRESFSCNYSSKGAKSNRKGKHSKSMYTLNPTVHEFCPSPEVLQKVMLEPLSSCSEQSSSLEGKDEVPVIDQIKQIKDKENQEQVQKAKTDEAPSKPRSMEEFFKKNKPKDRFERKFGHVQTKIPDLSFIKDDSSDYYSVSDMESSGKNSHVSRTSKSKDEGVTKKIVYKENYPEIPHSDIPNMSDICVVTYIHDLSEFYIARIAEDLNLLMEQLQEYAKNKRKNYQNKLYAKNAIGKYCIAYSTEFSTWNRAEVLDWQMRDPNNVDIQYVDFGEYATISFKMLFPLPEMFCKIPKIAIRTCLHNVVPDNAEGKWSGDAFAFFQTLCYEDNGAYANLRLIAIEKTSCGVAVDFYKGSDTGLTTCENMVFSGYAKLVQNLHKEQEADKAASRNFMIEQIRNAQGLAGISEKDDSAAALDKFCNVLPEVHDTMADAMLGYDAQDDMRICKFARSDGTCFKGASCKLEHKKRRKGGITTDTEVVLMAPENTFLPDVNEVFTVMITHFKSPSLLYGLVKHDGNGNGADFKEMNRCMNVAEMINSYEKFKYNPAVGELVIAKNFDRWHRAMVIDVNGGQTLEYSTAEVFFVDYGDMGEISLRDIRKMKPGFVIHPYQAIRLGVSNIRPLPNYAEPAFNQFMTENYLFRNLKLTVKYAGADFIDGTFQNESGDDMGTMLIRNNFARENTLDYYPLRTSNILVD